jgi:hypothetical protein
MTSRRCPGPRHSGAGRPSGLVSLGIGSDEAASVFVGLASVIGIALPRRLVSSVATRSPWQSLRRVIGRRTVQSPGRKQVGRLLLNWIAAQAEEIAAVGIVRQSRIWRLEPSGIYIIKINASAK